MLRLRVKHLISGVLSVSAWCVAFVFGHHYDAEAETPVVGNKLSCGGPASFDSYNVYTGYSFEAGGTGVCVFVCKPGYATYIDCSAAAYTGCSSAYTGTNDGAWNMWINTECSTGCAYSGYESLDADTTGLTNAVYNYGNIGASGLYFYTGCTGANCSYNGTPPQKCEGIRFYAKFDCGSGTAGSSSVRAMGAQVGENFTFPAASNCTAPTGSGFSQWISN